MKKKFFWLLVGMFFLFILLFALSRANGEQAGGPSLGDATLMTEVATAYGAPQIFQEQLMIGASRGTPATLPAGTIFTWLVENTGRARRVQTRTSLNGWSYAGDIAGKEVVFFYPADKSFLFAVVEKSPPAPVTPPTAPPALTAPATQQPTGQHQISNETIEVSPLKGDK